MNIEGTEEQGIETHVIEQDIESPNLVDQSATGLSSRKM